MNRPLLWAALAFALGIWCAGRPAVSAPWLVLAGVALLALSRWPGRMPWRDGLLVAALFFIAGAALEGLHRPQRLGDPLAAHNRAHPDRLYRLEGAVAAAPVYTPGLDYMTVRLRADRVWVGDRESALEGGVVVRWSEPAFAVHPGERIAVAGRLDPVLGAVNVGVRGVEDYYRTHGYHSVLRVRGDRATKRSSPTFNPRYWASRLRQWQAEVFTATAPEAVQPFLRAVWLGDRAAYTDEAYRPYLETGTAHILAVSGVHVGIVYLSLQWLLQSFVRDRKRRAALIMLGVVLFALVAGARTPILRAALMVCLYRWAELLDREPDAPTALSIAALLFLGYNPGLLRDTGFALSFTSLASILIFSEALNERLTALPQGIRQNVAAATGVSVLPLPLGAQVFHVVPVIGPLCNLLVIPLLTAILWLCILTVATATVSIEAARLFGHAAAPLVDAIAVITQAAAAAPLASLSVTSPTLLAWLIYGAAAFCFAQWLYARPHARRWLTAGLVALVGAWLCWRPWTAPATLDFLDVAHGDATFVRTPGGTTLLVDAGDRSDYVDMGTRVVVPWLRAHGIDRLDYVVVTHPDRDHIGGLAGVMDRIDTEMVLLWPDATENPLEHDLLARCAAAGIPVRRVRAGDAIPAAGARITVRHPPEDAALANANDQSLVLQVRWPGMNALLTGDIEAAAERALLPSIPPATILKAPHHGSHTSSTGAFLDAVAPRIAVVSTRRSGRRDAVGEGVLPRYAARGIAVYRTDYLGGIQIRPRGGGLTVQSARGMRGYTLDPNGP